MQHFSVFQITNAILFFVIFNKSTVHIITSNTYPLETFAINSTNLKTFKLRMTIYTVHATIGRLKVLNFLETKNQYNCLYRFLFQMQIQ